MPNILVVGEINLDMTVMISDSIDLRTKSSYEAEQTMTAIGGKAFAQAVQIANLDCNVTPIAMIGGNEENAIKNSLNGVQRQQNARADISPIPIPNITINLEHLISVPRSDTDTLLIVRKNHREASDTSLPTADFYLKLSSHVGNKLGSEHIKSELIEWADLVLLNSSIPSNALNTCLDLANEYEKLCVLSITAQFDPSLAKRATYIVVDPNRPDQVVRRPPRNMLITDGWSSCQYDENLSITSDYRLNHETLPHGLNVRSAFEAALAVMLARGKPLETSIEFALKAGVYKGQLGNQDVLRMGTENDL